MKKAGTEGRHWSECTELAAGYWQMRLMLFLFKLKSLLPLKLCAFPVTFVYYLFAGKARRESRAFLKQVKEYLEMKGETSHFKCSVLKHFLAFSLTMIEKIEAWAGRISFQQIHFQDDDIGELIAGLEQGKGAVLICSHLGNVELLRGLAGFNRTGVSREVPVTTIVDIAVTAHFNRMIRELNPDSAARIISTGDIGPDTVILLQDRVAQGELAVIAGDRTSEHTRDRYFTFPFLGREAPFGRGAFFLAALLNAPVYFVFALRSRDISLRADYNMFVHKSPLSFDCSRREREDRIKALARDFAACLEEHCKRHPHQWYNFFDFWALPDGAGKERENQHGLP